MIQAIRKVEASNLAPHTERSHFQDGFRSRPVTFHKSSLEFAVYQYVCNQRG
jgi:hypothetical protein